MKVLHADLCLWPHLPGKCHGAESGLCCDEDSGAWKTLLGGSTWLLYPLVVEPKAGTKAEAD